MKFEVLISIMFKTDLTFLKKVFSNNNIDDYNILIINQTDNSKLLYSENKKIRVINSFERGTSSSRNLAIENSKGEFCLFADDDVVYKKDFQLDILKSFSNNFSSGILSFECSSKKGKLHNNYPPEGNHDKKTLKKIHTIVIGFKSDIIKNKEVRFNEYFSYKGLFSGGGEYVFLRRALTKKVNIKHIKKIIVFHPTESSGKDMSSKENIYSRAAMTNHYYGSLLSFLWVLKYVFFLFRNKFINLSQVNEKLSIGFKGVFKYNELHNKGLIERQK